MPTRDLVVSGLLPGENNLTTSCHRDSKSANFSTSACSFTEEAGKNLQTGFFGIICGLPQAFYRDLRPATIVIVGAKDKFSFYTV
jgi:hypothetical protein